MALKWGIIGCGGIASKFAQDLSIAVGSELYAVASRSAQKANVFANQYGASKSYGSYEEICKDDQVDIIYIATPHSHHHSVGLMVINHGKALLCEKPMGVNAKQVQELVKVARDNKVFLMEALWTRFNPCVKEVYHRVKRGDIGEVTYINADFYFTKEYDANHRLYNPDLAGGALLDIGVYPIFLSYLMLGKPQSIISKSRMNGGGVDVQTSVILDYKNAQSILSFGFQTRSDMRGCINGKEGSIQILDRWHEATSYNYIKNGKIENIEVEKLGLGYTHEILECTKCIKEGKIESDLWSHSDSTNLIEICDEIRRQNKAKYPFEIN